MMANISLHPESDVSPASINMNYMSLTKMPLSLLILTVLLSSGVSVSADEDPLVECPQGKVRGYKMKSRSGREVLAFAGIPYATPPVGNLRFQAPKPLPPWSEVKEAKKEGPFCIQISMFDPTRTLQGSEDCLYLSVYTHDTKGKAPVLVHFHGGAFSSGNSQLQSPVYVLDEDLVVVKVNYRVGIIGFLSFENADMPGNYGLKDTAMALRWVKENIASFGGDPQKVTIIGESSGGATVSYHIVSPVSRGLFHKAIAESGSRYNNWAITAPGHAKRQAEKLMGVLNCPTDSKQAIPCLLKKDSKEIVSHFFDFAEWQSDPVVPYGPVFEPPSPEAFLLWPPSKWDAAPVPLLTGATTAEGLLRLAVLALLKTDMKWFSDNFDKLAPLSLLYRESASNPSQVTKEIRRYYLPNKEITMNDWVNLTMLYSDSWFLMGVIEGANNNKGDVYFYLFDYILKGNYFLKLDSKLVPGAFHCTESSLIWNYTFAILPTIEGDEELKLSQQFIKFIANFATFGDPTPNNDGIQWEKWTSDNQNYLLIGNEGYQMKKGLKEDAQAFWKNSNYRDNLI